MAASFRGLAHPTRLQILDALRTSGPMSPAQMVRHIKPKLMLGSVSHHTRELRTLGLIAPAGTQFVRGAVQHFYRLTPDGHRLMGLVDELAA